MFPKSFEPVSVRLQGSHRNGWKDVPELVSDPALIPVHAVGLHYGQIAFEGLRARWFGDHIEIFRPELHWERLNRSMARLSMPPLDLAQFQLALADLLSTVRRPPEAPDEFLYVRPLALAVDPDWSMGGSESFELHILAGWTGEAFSRAPRVVALVEATLRRTWPGGTGDVKIPANYGPAFAAQQQALDAGAHTVLWLDPTTRDIEEFSSMNAVFVDACGTLCAPSPSPTVLAGVTRRSLVELARGAGIPVDETPIRWPDASDDGGGLRGVLLATGTAVGVAVVDEVKEVWSRSDVRTWRSVFPNERFSELRDLTRSCFWGDARPGWWSDVDALRRGTPSPRA